VAHVILVHGAYAKPSSWFGVKAALLSDGHTVVAVDLRHAVSETLPDFATKIEEALPTSGKAVLIGHSLGGMSITQVATRVPNKIGRLVYVAAFLPQDGQSANDILGAGASSILIGFMRMAVTHGLGLLGVIDRRANPPLSDSYTRINDINAIPKHYLLCDDDEIIPPKKQEEMIDAANSVARFDLDSDHIPQLSRADILNTELARIAGLP